jgi:nucleotide-binding universal stress UspA family protein
MLIDFKVFFKDFETIKVAITMTIVATLAKFLAAYFTQKIFKFSRDERRLIFGLSNAQAAATLAAVLVGFQLGIFQESVLNGTIVMILITCTIASFVAQRGAQKIAVMEISENENREEEIDERILIPVNRMETTEELLNLSITVKSKNNKSGMYALNVIDNSDEFGVSEKHGRKIIELASTSASSVDVRIHELLRFDVNIVNGISNVVKEHKITDMIMGFNEKEFFNDSFFGNLTDGILSKCNTTTMVYKSNQPLSTIKRHLIIVPDRAEREIGFPFWLVKIWNISRNTGAKLVFYSSESTINIIKEINANHPIPCDFNTFNEWTEFLILAKEVKSDDNVIVVLSRKDRPSYNNIMPKIPIYLVKHFNSNNFILVYPMQLGVKDDNNVDFKNPSVLEPLGKLDDIGKTISWLFKRK